MSVKSKHSKRTWIDPDDAPEFTGAELNRVGTVWRVAGKPVSEKEGKAQLRKHVGKKQVNMMLDVDVIEHFKSKAGGRGYQTLINETLKQTMRHETLEKIIRRIIREELRKHAA